MYNSRKYSNKYAYSCYINYHLQRMTRDISRGVWHSRPVLNTNDSIKRFELLIRPIVLAKRCHSITENSLLCELCLIPFESLGNRTKNGSLLRISISVAPSFRVPRRQIRQTRVVKAVEDKYAA